VFNSDAPQGASTSPAEPDEVREPTPDLVVAAYLANFEQRLALHGGRRYFARADQEVFVALLHRKTADRLPPGPSRSILERHVLNTVNRLVDDGDAVTQDLVTAVWLDVRAWLGIHTDPAQLVSRLGVGVARHAAEGVLPLAERCAALATARSFVDLSEPLEEELATRAEVLLSRARKVLAAVDKDRSPTISTAARLAWTLNVVGTKLHREDLLIAALELVTGADDAVRASSRRDGSSDILTAHAAQVVVAAEAVVPAVAAAAATEVLGRRVVPESGLLKYADDTPKLEFSPWVPLAFAPALRDATRIYETLYPSVVAVPTFSLTALPSNSRGLHYLLENQGRAVPRDFDQQDLNFILDRALSASERFEDNSQSARTHGHRIIALHDLVDICDDQPTRASVDALIDRSLTSMLMRQGQNGGWSYARPGNPSRIYSASGLKTTDFPVHEYSIDVAVPGIALAECYRRSGDDRCLQAAYRALGFFEQVLGRLVWDDKPVWRLFPSDEKTAKQGTAVNYELWNALFFASLARADPDGEAAPRLLQYVDDALTYTRGHLLPNGDIQYGDYVHELRTAYASWDALLLAEIAEVTGNTAVLDMAQAIIKRLEEVMLPSGMVPNVADYSEQIGGTQRWSVHRHGIGPFPVRTNYQLYYVVAAAVANSSSDAGNRALGFVLTAFFEPGFGGMGAGHYGGRGEFDQRAGFFDRDWTVHALALLHRSGSLDYRPCRSDVRTARERLLRLVAASYADAVQGRGSPQDESSCQAAEVHVALARGALSMFRATAESEWMQIARNHLEPIATGTPGLLRLLLDFPADFDLGPRAEAESARLRSRLQGRASPAAPARVTPDESSAFSAARVRMGDREGFLPSVHLLLLQQGPDGLWRGSDDRTTGLVHVRVVLDLLDLIEGEVNQPDLRGAVEAAVVGGSGFLFTAEGSRQCDGRASTGIGAAMLFVLALVRASRVLQVPEYASQARRTLRLLLHTDRTPFGVLGASKYERATASEQADVFSALAGLYELVPDIFERAS
jgi:hypothetical protein